MSTSTATRIAYPTFVEHLEQLRGSGTTFGAMAKRIGTQEATVIGWTNGTAPGTRFLQAIEKELGYSFTARRFAEAANDAAFPPAGAPSEIAAITTYEAFIAYLLLDVRKIVTLPALAGFFGWGVSNLSNMLVHPEFARDREQLADALRRLPQLPDHLSGAVLSRCTPRAVIGQLLRDARQARGQSVDAYAKRIGITPDMLKIVEASGTGHQSPSKATTSAKATVHRSEFFKVPAEFDRILDFLRAEREALGDRLATPALAASLPQEPVPPPAEVAAAPRASSASAAPSGMSRRAVHDRLQVFVGRMTLTRASVLLAIPKSTIQGVLNHAQQAKRTTIVRIAAALDANEPAPAAPAVQTPVVGAASSLECRLAELEEQVRNLTAGSGNASSSPDSREYTSPLSRGRFRPHDDPVSPERLDAVRERIQRVCEDLGALASTGDDQHRWRVQRALGALVDELYVTLEGFMRKYPSGALVTLDEQRRFHDEHRGRLAAEHNPATDPSSVVSKKED
ncbi:MAG: hypothetical protein Q7R80_00380 [bacterium]|nr:hypothetical protein [bacterium]